MVDLIGEDGCAPSTNDILEGKVPFDIPKYPRLLLYELQKSRTTIPLDMTLDDMCTRFTKWRETTTTSPSGKHLGIYKALVIAKRFNILTTTEQERGVSYDSTTTIPIVQQCLQIQFLLMSIAIEQCHTFSVGR
jgi:hypothetical protein